MKFSPRVEQLISDERAIVCLGYPWWLKRFLASDVVAITLGHHIYLAARAAEKPAKYIDALMRHELMHVRQVNRHGIVLFLLRYLGEFVVHLIRERNFTRAYRRISFEVEAWAEEERTDV